MSFLSNLQSQDATAFGEDQGILNQIQSTYAPILAAGPSQKGFSDAEDNDLNTQADEAVGNAYAGASKTLRETQAAQGGGDTFVPSGVNDQQQEQLISSAANQDATEKQQITQADYAQGNENFNTAGTELLNAGNELNPNAYAGSATSAGSAAGTTANQIEQESNSWEAPLLGAVGAVGGAALKYATFGAGGGGSSSSGDTADTGGYGDE